MLKTTLRAGIPLVSVHTDDPIFVHEVLNHAISEANEFFEITFKHLRGFTDPKIHSQSKFFYIVDPDEQMNWREIYETCDQNDISIVIVNAGFKSDLFYDLGELVTPVELIESYVSGLTGERRAAVIAPLFMGRTLKTVHWFCQLALAHHGKLTVESAQYVLKHNQPSVRGLIQVALEYPYYKTEPSVQRWWLDKGRLFDNKNTPRLLLPRGILCHGQSGTGKTLSAKVIAKRLDVNLYRIDLNGILDMYIGNSETYLTDALAFIEQVSPCVLLLDEVEKVFTRDDAAGVIDRLLSMLLWWLNEHRSQVLTVMTTNNMDILPPELHGKGRIDSVIEYKGMHSRAVPPFVDGVLKSISEKPLLSSKQIRDLVKDLQIRTRSTTRKPTQSEFTQLIYDQIRPLFIGESSA